RRVDGVVYGGVRLRFHAGSGRVASPSPPWRGDGLVKYTTTCCGESPRGGGPHPNAVRRHECPRGSTAPEASKRRRQARFVDPEEVPASARAQHPAGWRTVRPAVGPTYQPRAFVVALPLLQPPQACVLSEHALQVVHRFLERHLAAELP